jgi:hypothetical protein
MEWHHQLSSIPETIQGENFFRKVVASFFQDSEEILLVEFLERDDTIPGP